MWKQTLTRYSCTDLVVAVICPKWFKLIETWVSECFDSLVGQLRLRISRSKVNMRKILARFLNGFVEFEDDATLQNSLCIKKRLQMSTPLTIPSVGLCCQSTLDTILGHRSVFARRFKTYAAFNRSYQSRPGD